MPIDAGVSIAGVVLAAGASTRMGTNKLLLPIEGESLLRRAVRRALEARLDPVVLVTGHEAERSRGAVEGLACEIVFNPRYAEGIHTSVRAGIGAVPPASPAAVVMLADMPYVTADMVTALVEAYRRAKPPLVISQYGDAQAPPTLYDRSLFAELTIDPGEGCSKRVVRRHRDEAVALVWPAPALTDLDFPEDYDRARSADSAEARCAPTS